MSIHYIYKSSKPWKSRRHDYFACDTDPNKGTTSCVADWDRVTCPDCLEHRPQPVPTGGPPLTPALAKALRAPDLLTTVKLIQWFKEHPEVLDEAIDAIRPEPQVATSYTAGFAFHNNFHDNGKSILLIQKLKGPPGVKGRLNAIGGKIEPGEMANECQRREFREETGVDIPEERWEYTVKLTGPHNGGWEVFFFRTTLTNEEAGAVKSMEAEQISWHLVEDIPTLNVVGNLRWLVPMQLDTGIKGTVSVSEG